MIRAWRFPEGIDPATAPDGTEYDVVYAPDQFNHPRWRKVRFRIVVKHTGGRQSGRWHRVVKRRYLSEEEVRELELDPRQGGGATDAKNRVPTEG